MEIALLLGVFCVAKGKVKNEGAGSKRSAVELESGTSDDVQVASKPAAEAGMNRPAKRIKGAGERLDADEDVQVVGSAGTVVLPHNRFSCSEVRCHERVFVPCGGRCAVIHRRRYF